MSKKEGLQLEKIRHSLSHLMSMAIIKIYPDAGLGVGPAIENGFYQDYGLPESISSELLPKLEKEIKKMILKNIKFEQHDMSFDKALKLYKKDPYKSEMIKDLKKAGEKKLSFYRSDWFENLCKGPHVASTKEIDPDAFKLTKVAGAYWKGDEKNKMLQRVYGVAFETKKELYQYLKQQAEAEKRDHRKIGKELDLFVFSDLIGKGLPLLTPKGSIIRQELEKFITEEETKRGYLRVYTPDLARLELYKKSGHWQHYKESMYPLINVDGEDYVLRPMACPHHFMLYNSRPRSYRELPLRYAEIARQYRKEQSGELSGLIRLMAFSLVDAHLVCRPDQIEKEFKDVLELIQYNMKILGIKDYWYRFSKWDPKNKKKYTNNPKAWQKTEKLMKEILDKLKLKYVEAEDEAAFYGPKTDVQVKNVNGKEDTLFTVQIDFDMPGKFDMSYIDEKGKKQTPMVIHRASIGCIERTMAFLIEQYAGAMPVWLSPVQAQIIPISEKFIKYGEKIKEMLLKEDVRVELNNDNETLGKKIREGEMQKIPYLLIVGEKEQKAGSVAVRDREKGDLGPMKTNKFIEKIKEEIEKKI
ncbi:MAG: threonine--tRNA ligase [Parcubacteria group bacterium]|nr:threonine--tRNA ligase [Parcubacteria group bacterium]